jgi:Mn-dependent DtxR family transcriptional regulator
MDAVQASLSRRSKASVQNRLGELRHEKLVHGDAKTGYRLTRPGFEAAMAEARRLVI